MKSAKAGQKKAKRRAEDWVAVARSFGEKCIAVQHDSNLSADQKLEKQKVLCKEMTQEIQGDSDLKDDDKKRMVDSIKNYMDDWEKMHHALQNPSASQNEKKEKSDKKKK